MPDVVLTINARKYDGWIDVRIHRGIEQLSGMFVLTVSERWPGSAEPWPITPGDACTVTVDGITVITGHVDDVQPQFDAGEHRLQIAGRDAAGDLVDCSAANTPGRWENRTLTQIVVDLCKPFKINVKAQIDVGARFKSFALQPGETVYEAIERLCRFRGVLPVSDGLGNLVITGPGTVRSPVRLMQGENILAASGLLSWRDRHSQYIVKGCDSGFDTSTPEQNAGPKGTATDPNVNRHRPLIVIAEGPASSDKLKKRALWEAAVRRGRSGRAMITVHGWTHPKGVWSPNHLVNVYCPWLRINGDMIITSVVLLRDKDGTRTDLEICRPDGLKLITIEEEADLWSD